jgi:hypothetical protein
MAEVARELGALASDYLVSDAASELRAAG